MAAYTQTQTAFYVGILANAASAAPPGDVSELEAFAYKYIVGQLLESDPFIGEWEVVWGPAVYQAPLSKVADNTIFAAQAGPDTPIPGQIVIGIAGTNPNSAFDWLLEDFGVAHSVPWGYGQPGPGLKPRVSLGTHVGLCKLQSLMPGPGLPGFGTTIAGFLAATAPGSSRVTVSGHSLGGALTVAASLWLSDTQSTWNPGKKTALASVPSAGPTSGNKDFAAYFDSQLGSATTRIHNSLDLVPHAWQSDQLKQAPGLYEPEIPATLVLWALAEYAISVTQSQNYTHALESAPPLDGAINAKIIDPEKDACYNYAAQAIYQHVGAYFELLGLDTTSKSILLPLALAASPGADAAALLLKQAQRRFFTARKIKRALSAAGKASAPFKS
jgi:hypothetical protein